MRAILTLTLALGTAALIYAQDEGKMKVEQPLKKAIKTDLPKTFVIERPILEAVASGRPEKFDLSKTGIEWKRGLDAALNKGKPILLLQILGNYDDVYC